MVNATPIRSEDGELESFVVTYLDDRQNYLRDVARLGRLAKVRYCAIIAERHGRRHFP